MPMPDSDMKALLTIFEDQMPGGRAPWFGVNIQDINEDNLAAFEERVGPVSARVTQIPGVTRHFRALTDYGARKRSLWIVRYGESIDRELYSQLFDNDEYREEMLALGATLESYQWFRTYEIE